MALEFYNPGDPGAPDVQVPGGGGTTTQDIPKSGINGISPIFSGTLGVPISALSMGTIDPDPTGLTVTDDYDGDGIPNDQEGVNNPYVADYPQIVAGITGLITMEIRVLDTSLKDNYTEDVEFTEDNDTIKNSMEDWHYNQLKNFKPLSSAFSAGRGLNLRGGNFRKAH